jgi:transposase InsO family protein
MAATSAEFIKVLASREIKISMDGKGAWRDHVFIERLWRTIKYEGVLPAHLCQRPKGTRIDRALLRLLQRATPTFIA